MSFLQINSTDPSVKRPFRLSDIQDIWNGIKSLFKAISGQQFRIISGFDLVGGVYTSGTVWYNGELYEYDSNAYPITPSTTRVAFSNVAQDNRVLEGGNTQPFSYKYICGGDGLNGTITFTYFVANIEKYKSYLGNGSVTTEKLADESVTTNKLAVRERIPTIQYDSINLIDVGTSTVDLEGYVTPTGFPTMRIANDAPAVINVLSRVSASSPAIAFLEVYNTRTSETTLVFGTQNVRLPAYSQGALDPVFITLVRHIQAGYNDYVVTSVSPY